MFIQACDLPPFGANQSQVVGGAGSRFEVRSAELGCRRGGRVCWRLDIMRATQNTSV
jgi:hypothetical protein